MTTGKLLIAFLACVAVLLGGVGPARAAETPLVRVADDSPMSAAGGWVGWSERGADGAWRLVTWHQGVRAVPDVPPRTVPFDVDLGTTEHGRVVATYSRCTQDPRPGGPSAFALQGVVTAFAARGCSVRQLDLATGRESRLPVRRPAGALDVSPSRSGRFVAFARHLRGARVFGIERVDLRTGRRTELPHGRMPPRGSQTTGEVDALDLGPKALAFTWRLLGEHVIGTSLGWETRIESVRPGGARSLVGSGYISGACGGLIPSSPSVVGTAVTFVELDIHCDIPTTDVVTTALGGKGRQLTSRGVLVRRVARAGSSQYEVREPASDPPRSTDGDADCHDPATPCVLVRLTPAPTPPTPRGRIGTPLY